MTENAVASPERGNIPNGRSSFRMADHPLAIGRGTLALWAFWGNVTVAMVCHRRLADFEAVPIGR